MSTDTEDWYLEHPRLDYIVAALLPVGTYLLLAVAGINLDDDTATTIAVGMSTVAGLSMASCVFVCTLTYQSAHPKIVSARRHHSSLARKNWIAIIGATFTAALLPVCSLVLLSTSTWIVVLVSAVSAGLVVARFLRSMLWLSLILFASDQPEDSLDQQRRVVRPPAPEREQL